MVTSRAATITACWSVQQHSSSACAAAQKACVLLHATVSPGCAPALKPLILNSQAAVADNRCEETPQEVHAVPLVKAVLHVYCELCFNPPCMLHVHHPGVCEIGFKHAVSICCTVLHSCRRLAQHGCLRCLRCATHRAYPCCSSVRMHTAFCRQKPQCMRPLQHGQLLLLQKKRAPQHTKIWLQQVHHSMLWQVPAPERTVLMKTSNPPD